MNNNNGIDETPTSEINLPPPGNELFTLEQLKAYNGKTEKAIYIALKGTVFNVTSRQLIYGDGCSFHVFAGRDASKAVGKSTIKEEDVDADYSGLNADQMKTLNSWYEMYSKKYPIVGKVTDVPV